MIRNFKTLGIALAAIFALSGLASQTALAGETYHAPNLAAGATVFFTVEQDSVGGNQVFSTESGSVTCKKIHGVGEQINPSHELTFEPVYTECSAFGFATAHITNHKCHYTFTTPTDIAGQPTKHTIHPPHVGGTTVEACKITITPTTFGASVCTQTVEAQTPTGGHLIATNIPEAGGVPGYVTAETTITGIHYTSSGGACGSSGVTHTEGTYSGNTNVTCFSDPARTKKTTCTIT